MLRYFQHQQCLNVYAAVETKIPAPMMGVALNSASFTNQKYMQKMITKATMVQLKVISNSNITNTQNPLETVIMKMILSFQIIYGN